MRSHLATAMLVAFSAACGGKTTPGTTNAAAAPAPTVATAQTTPARSSRDVITRAEIEQTQGVPNAYDLIRRLRPHFFRVEGRSSFGSVQQSPLVRLDGSVLGELSSLQTIAVTGLEEIRYYSIVEAETKWSGDRGRPVIHVTTRKLTGK
ncbi:MAG: hypothetical protein ACREOG_12345 [Gemmatimonadaceae bacterium]